MREPRASRPTPEWLGGGEPVAWSWALEQLASERNYWIVSVRKDGFPQARPVWGVWHADVLYVSIGHGGIQRTRVEDQSLDVTIHVDSAVDVVVLEGRLERASDTPDEAVANYNAKYNWDATTSLLNYVFTPVVAYGWRDEDVKTAAKWTFD